MVYWPVISPDQQATASRAQCKREGLRRPQTFNFLGFTHIIGRTRSGRFVVGRKTQDERIRKKLAALNVRLAALPWMTQAGSRME